MQTTRRAGFAIPLFATLCPHLVRPRVYMRDRAAQWTDRGVAPVFTRHQIFGSGDITSDESSRLFRYALAEAFCAQVHIPLQLYTWTCTSHRLW